MPAWPASLPQYVLEQGYGESFTENKIESPMEKGKAKQRRRFTKQLRRFRVTVEMHAAQAVTFEHFYETTLRSGSLSFDWVHPRTREAKTFRFRNPPPSVSIKGEAVRFSFVLETV